MNVATSSGTVMASISYTAAVTPVTINLSGVRKVNGQTFALTGAEVTASLNTGAFQNTDFYLWTPEKKKL